MPHDARGRDGAAGGDPAGAAKVGMEAAGSSRRLTAHAKINLALHILGRRSDGYHALDSLVAFAALGDTLTITDSARDTFSCDGPFSSALGEAGGEGNSVTAALAFAREHFRANAPRPESFSSHPSRSISDFPGSSVASTKPEFLRRTDAPPPPAICMSLPPLGLHLHKTLPVASGIGGGSADAGALLRHVGEQHPGLAGSLRDASVKLGADVPMCIDGVPARVEGIGEIATPLGAFPSIAMVLVNPGVAVSTPAVFRALTCRDNAPIPPLPVQGFADLGALLAFLAETRNDLEAPALSIAPEIAEVRDALASVGAAFARMSGSGATVFGLFTSDNAAARAADILSSGRPGWWVKATHLMGTPA